VAIFSGGWSGARCNLALFLDSIAKFTLALETPSNVVDLFNGATQIWSTAQLNVARHYIEAVSVKNFAILAGGMLCDSFQVELHRCFRHHAHALGNLVTRFLPLSLEVVLVVLE
jgi:hypothetical protein